MVINRRPHRLHAVRACNFLTPVTFRRKKILLLPEVKSIVIHKPAFYALACGRVAGVHAAIRLSAGLSGPGTCPHS